VTDNMLTSDEFSRFLILFFCKLSFVCQSKTARLAFSLYKTRETDLRLKFM